ncbi:MAG: dihydroorotase [Planctomycetota bacterium]|jgi:dihydroorotase
MSWIQHRLLLLKGGTIVTSSGRQTADVLIREGVIDKVGPDLQDEAAHVEDVSGLFLLPGFVDVHVHLRDPGAPDSEVLESGLEAAAAGGIHHIFCMANTDPVNDDPDITADLVARAAQSSPLVLHPVAAVTRGLVGDTLTDFAAHKDAGAGALSNDGLPVEHTGTLATALEQASEHGLTVLVHCEDRDLAGDGALDSRIAARLGAKGIPIEAEDVATARDVGVAVEVGARLHVCHVSTVGSVDIVRRAREQGHKISAEATPHHLFLTYDDIAEGDTDFKMNPPLRATADVEALIEGIEEGIVTAIATDHAPHSPQRKATDFDHAPFGAIGLETSFPVSYTALVQSGRIPLERLVALYVDGPAEIAGIAAPRIEPGARAEINLVDLEATWVVDPAALRSLSRNCPFKGRRLTSRIAGVVAGRSLRR